MHKLLSRRNILIAVAVVAVVAIIIAAIAVSRRSPAEKAESRSPQMEVKRETPPDLAKYRAAYAAGVAALEKKDAAEAVKQLGSFSFGTRAVEQYRLYYLAKAHEQAGNAAAARSTLAQLWRHKPAMVYASDAAATLASMHQQRGDWRGAAEIAAANATRTTDSAAQGTARWQTFELRLAAGDLAGAVFAARNIPLKNPKAKTAGDALDVLRAVTGVTPGAELRLTAEERLERAVNLMRDGDAAAAERELAGLEAAAPESLRAAVRLNRGLALHHLRRFEDSNKYLEPLTASYYKYAIPALYYAARNYRVLSASINPDIYKTVVEKKQVGTIKQVIGKGKKKRTITKPRFANVSKQIKLVDLDRKRRKDEYDRLGTERLKDLLSLPLSPPVRIEVLNAMIERAITKTQTDYIKTLVPQAVKVDVTADPALQYIWDRAWGAYARDDLNGAKPLFRFIADTYKNVNVRRQSEYWYARTIERLGDREGSAAIYKKLAASPYVDVYAQHSLKRGAARPPNQQPDTNREDWPQIAEREMPRELRLGYELTALSQTRDARVEIERNMSHANTRYAHALLVDLYAATGEPLQMYKIFRQAWPQIATVEQDQVPPYFMKLYYPMRYHDSIRKYAKENGLDPYLVMALILQESYYNPKAKSRVGATGLMQLMPPTAKELAHQLRVPFAVTRLENPEVNVRLGTRHLKMLVNMFGGETKLAVASYNAGQGNVMKWRRAAPRKPLDEFLESIPFPETRNYVKRVTLLTSSYERLAP